MIVRQITDRWGTHVDIKMDDGRDIEGLSIVAFSDEYKGHGGTRFVTEDAYRDFRQAQIDKIEAQLAERDAERSLIAEKKARRTIKSEQKKKESRTRMGTDLTEEDVDELRDEDVPIYAIRPFTTALLIKIARGDVDMKRLAAEELENRGVDPAKLSAKKKDEADAVPYGVKVLAIRDAIRHGQIFYVNTAVHGKLGIIGIDADGSWVRTGSSLNTRSWAICSTEVNRWYAEIKEDRLDEMLEDASREAEKRGDPD